ncbi:MAG: DNA primase small subunit PriS [Candidatus Jordarchaeales archaeon]|nr:DNA primase small subunit PriS [Candidatus Jordarchaeia archaeon]
MSLNDRQTKNEVFLKNLFRKYYQENKVEPPSSMEKREFGFMFFGAQTMVRHLAFSEPESLQRFLVSRAPSNAFHSAAYYAKPDATRMDEKVWEGCDLVFDIDADHLKTSCKEVHDKWICQHCGQSGPGKKPEKCPVCGEQNIEEKTWLCEECLETAKDELTKLIEDYLTADFGISTDELKVVFSGHRGYHVHVTSEALLDLDQNARREIVDYIKGVGLEPRYHGLVEARDGRSKILRGPRANEDGWRGRLTRGVVKTILSMDESSIPQERKVKNALRVLLKDKDKVADSLREGVWDTVRGVGIDVWGYIARLAVEKVGGRIDEPVTADIRRLIRLPTSLHGKTGFKVCPVPLRELSSFDPFKHALAFRGEATIHVDEAPKFRVGEEEFGPFKDEDVELPLSAAVLLICKGFAYLRG